MSTISRNGQLPNPTLPPTPPPRQSNRISTSNAISCLPYYHPHVSDMEQIKQLLSSYMHIEGSFILRNSISKPGFFTLSVTHSTGIKHLNVEITSLSATPYYYLRESVKFETMNDLVNYYGRECIPNKEKINNVRLLYPIPRASSSQPLNQSSQPPHEQVPQPSPRATGNEYKLVWSDVPGAFQDTREGTYISTGECEQNPSTLNPNSVNASKNTVALGRRSDSPNFGYSRIPSELPLKRDELIKRAMREETDVIRCDCGLLVEEATMPRGWSVHLSQHPSSLGEVYFMSPEGQCHWTLPLAVSLELTATQQDLIRDLILDFEAQTNRIARAKSASSPGGAGYMGPPTSSDHDSTHHRSWVAILSNDSNYVAPSPPGQLALSAQIVSTSSGRLSRGPPSTDDDDDSETPGYMVMDGTRRKKV